MIQKDLIKKIKNDRNGYIYVEVSNFNDSFWVQAVKSDLINMLKERFQADQETGFELDNMGYFGKDYSNAN